MESSTLGSIIPVSNSTETTVELKDLAINNINKNARTSFEFKLVIK